MSRTHNCLCCSPPVLLTNTIRGQFAQDHVRLCHFHFCFHLVELHGSSFISRACVDCHHFVVFHLVSTAAVGFSSQTIPQPSMCFQSKMVKFISTHIPYPFSTFGKVWTIHHLCLPSFDSVESFSVVQEQCALSTREDATDVFHHSSALEVSIER